MLYPALGATDLDNSMQDRALHYFPLKTSQIFLKK